MFERAVLVFLRNVVKGHPDGVELLPEASQYRTIVVRARFPNAQTHQQQQKPGAFHALNSRVSPHPSRCHQWIEGRKSHCSR
jgi:hypothetical protein